VDLHCDSDEFIKEVATFREIDVVDGTTIITGGKTLPQTYWNIRERTRSHNDVALVKQLFPLPVVSS
jgi:hypothetical protein